MKNYKVCYILPLQCIQTLINSTALDVYLKRNSSLDMQHEQLKENLCIVFISILVLIFLLLLHVFVTVCGCICLWWVFLYAGRIYGNNLVLNFLNFWKKFVYNVIYVEEAKFLPFLVGNLSLCYLLNVIKPAKDEYKLI